MRYRYSLRNGVTKAKTNTRKYALTAVVSIFAACGIAVPALAATGGGGFDQYGYNYGARVFNGTGGSWCEKKYSVNAATCATDAYMGKYAKDKLIMKWNARWDECNVANSNGTNDSSTCSGATLTNEWNGNVPGGSGDTEHFKAVWYGPCTEGATLPDGGKCIWGQYETIMDQGMSEGVHTVWTQATPAGFGVSR